MMTTSRTPQDRFVDVEGLRLHYLDWGNDAAPKQATADQMAAAINARRAGEATGPQTTGSVPAAF